MAEEEAKVVCKLRMEFPSAEVAGQIHASVHLDNEGYLDSRVEGRAIVAEVRADNLKSLLHTLEDFMSCTSVAEKIVLKQATQENPSP